MNTILGERPAESGRYPRPNGRADGQDRLSQRPVVALVAHNVGDENGTGRVCAELIRNASPDFNFVVVSTVLDESLRPFVREWLKVRTPQRPFLLKFTTFWVQAAILLRGQQVDIVHSVGAIVPTRVDLASVHHCHAGFVGAERRLAPRSAPIARRTNTAIARLLALAAERWCYRPSRLRALAAVSAGVQDELLAHYPDLEVHVTPNGVDRSCFRPDVCAREEVRRSFGAKEDDTVAIFVGGDWHHKGLAIAFEALARAKRLGADLRLWVVGAGDQKRFAALASELGVASSVSFLGPRNDVDRLLAAADLFVLPSAYEAHSLVTLEAASCGLPIVATQVNGVDDLLGDGKAGVLVERDARSVAAALTSLTKDQALRAQLGRAALERSEKYSWQASAAAVSDLYRSVLDS